jgi:hypothetical protein
MKRSPVDALRDGAGRVAAAPMLLAAVWLILVSVTVPPVLLMRASLADHLGSSLMADQAAEGVNYDWMVEFNQQRGSGGIVGPLSPSVIGFAAVLDNLSAFFDRTPRALVVTLTGLSSLVMWVFLTGGIFDRLARARPTSVHEFFSAAGVYFLRFVRLGLIAAAVYGLLIGLVYPWLLDEYGALSRELTVERTAFLLRTAVYALFALALASVNMVFDYAKVRAVVEDRRSMTAALAASAQFLTRNASAAIPLYAVNLAISGGVIGLYAAAAPGAVGFAGSTWVAFAIGQIYLLGRLWAKLVMWASEIALFQRRLGHAGYVARPVARWPDSPGVEAVRRAGTP